MLTKLCSKCKINKLVSEFYRSRKGKFGVGEACKICTNKRVEQWREKNYKKIQVQHKLWYQKNTQKVSNYAKLYRILHPKRVKTIKNKWRKNNLDKVRKIQKIYRNKKYNRDIKYKLMCLLRNRLGKALKRNQKLGHTLNLLGCSISDFKRHIERQFQSGMMWKNYGYTGWHIDHKKPIASFDLSNLEEQKKCFHFTNLQPMWGKDNIKKSDKWED